MTQEITTNETQLPAGNEDIIQNRLDMLGGEIRSSFDQGLEMREAPQEAASTGIGELPVPPPPPNK